jgi:phenylpyruvate tautomerase PptA (4-oxalocrotonate tautomerase family)
MIQVPRNALSDDRKAAIATSITTIHRTITDDDANSIEIAITEIDAGCFFAGGRLIECDHIFVHGYVSAELRADGKDELCERLSAAVTEAAGFDPESTWVTISTS